MKKNSENSVQVCTTSQEDISASSRNSLYNKELAIGGGKSDDKIYTSFHFEFV